MLTRQGSGAYPGVVSLLSLDYTASHGIQPGTAVLRMAPQLSLPAAQGDLVLTDGVGKVVVPGCKLERLVVEQGESGTVWSLELSDRRWRWRDFGMISGAYNQLDPHAKLIPWTVRSPAELATLCLKAMGETKYALKLPPGLNFPGPFVSSPLPNVSGVNPPVNWEQEVPAQALSSLADLFGCRVVYDPVTDSVYVGPPGVGGTLPPGSVHKRGPTLTAPAVPDGLAVAGAPTRYQARLGLDAVGVEWDGSYRFLKALSYAPTVSGAAGVAQVSTLTPAGTTAAGVVWKVTVEYTVANLPAGQKQPAPVQFGYNVGSGVVATELTGLAAAINGSADPTVSKLSATSDGAKVTVTGKVSGDSFTLDTSISGTPQVPPSMLTVALATAATKAEPQKVSWDYSAPPLFPTVQATSRLTKEQAQALARKSVFRCYRLSDVDASGKGPIQVPGYGPLLRRQQVVLQETQVDQITPQQLDPQLIGKDGKPYTVNFYNGYSHDKPAAVYGRVRVSLLDNALWGPGLKQGDPNTPAGSQVFVDFSFDPFWQVITFNEPVYFLKDGRFLEPQLVLQTAVNVRNADTNQLEVYVNAVSVSGGSGTGNPAVQRHPDVQLEVTSVYGIENDIRAVSLLEADPVLRSTYYLAGMAQQYTLKDGGTAEYNGVVPVSLDGAIAQVTWSVGGGGPARTTASRNTEHSVYVPPYPARRRAEFLRPAKMLKLQDAAAPQRVDLAEPPK
jgi:hypothetical protein